MRQNIKRLRKATRLFRNAYKKAQTELIGVEKTPIDEYAIKTYAKWETSLNNSTEMKWAYDSHWNAKTPSEKALSMKVTSDWDAFEERWVRDDSNEQTMSLDDWNRVMDTFLDALHQRHAILALFGETTVINTELRPIRRKMAAIAKQNPFLALKEEINQYRADSGETVHEKAPAPKGANRMAPIAVWDDYLADNWITTQKKHSANKQVVYMPRYVNWLDIIIQIREIMDNNDGFPILTPELALFDERRQLDDSDGRSTHGIVGNWIPVYKYAGYIIPETIWNIIGESFDNIEGFDETGL